MTSLLSDASVLGMRRVIRIIEYFGPKEWLDSTLAATALPLRGAGADVRSQTGKYQFHIREVAMIEIPELATARYQDILAKPIPNFPIDVPAVIDDREPVTVPDDAYWVEDLT